MPSSLQDRLESAHPRNVRMGLSDRHLAHLAHVKAQPAHKQGPAVEAALKAIGVTPKQAALATRKALACVYAWFKGTERPAVDELCEAFGEPFEHAYMEQFGLRCAGCTVTETISFQKAATA